MRRRNGSLHGLERQARLRRLPLQKSNFARRPFLRLVADSGGCRLFWVRELLSALDDDAVVILESLLLLGILAIKDASALASAPHLKRPERVIVKLLPLRQLRRAGRRILELSFIHVVVTAKFEVNKLQ